MKRILEIMAEAWFIVSGCVALIWTSPNACFEYPRPSTPKNPEVRSSEVPRQEYESLNEEVDRFCAEIGTRGPNQWTFGERAWYESIRRREAMM